MKDLIFAPFTLHVQPYPIAMTKSFLLHPFSPALWDIETQPTWCATIFNKQFLDTQVTLASQTIWKLVELEHRGPQKS